LELGLIGTFFIISTLLIFAIVASQELVQFFSIFESVTLIERFLDSIETISNGEGRLAQYANSFILISESPLTGGYLEDPKFMVYPHNIFLESLMSLGIIGGILIVYLIYKSVRNAILLSRKNPGYKIFTALLIQYVVAAQFSGSLYTSTAMWALIGFFCTVNSLELMKDIKKN
jgi:O-antigen ligase